MIALGAAALAAPGIIGSTRSGGAVVGHPERIFTPARLVLITLGWLGTAALAWRPLPLPFGNRSRAALLVVGSGAYVAGFALAVSGRLALGRSYRPSSTIGVALEPGHRLVTDGPYGLVRHPMYLGLALAALGALAVYRTWSTLLFVLQIPVLVMRANQEDLLLAMTYGEEWLRYSETVPGWVPRARPAARRLSDTDATSASRHPTSST